MPMGANQALNTPNYLGQNPPSYQMNMGGMGSVG